MDPKGLKRFNKRQTCRRSNCDKIQNFGSDGGDGGDGAFANTLRAVNSRRINRADIAVRTEYKCKRQEYAVAQFHSRSDTPTPRLSPSTRIARSAFDPSRSTPTPFLLLRSPPIHRAASPYRSERVSGNPKLCAAATRGHLNQCLSNWVKSFQSMLINFISVYLPRYVCLGQNFANRIRDEIISAKPVTLIITYYLTVILIVTFF